MTAYHDAFVKRIAAETEDITNEIVNRTPTDWGEYQYRCGIVEGIRRAIATSAALSRQIQEG